MSYSPSFNVCCVSGWALLRLTLTPPVTWKAENEVLVYCLIAATYLWRLKQQKLQYLYSSAQNAKIIIGLEVWTKYNDASKIIYCQHPYQMPISRCRHLPYAADAHHASSCNHMLFMQGAVRVISKLTRNRKPLQQRRIQRAWRHSSWVHSCWFATRTCTWNIDTISFLWL